MINFIKTIMIDFIKTIMINFLGDSRIHFAKFCKEEREQPEFIFDEEDYHFTYTYTYRYEFKKEKDPKEKDPKEKNQNFPKRLNGESTSADIFDSDRKDTRGASGGF